MSIYEDHVAYAKQNRIPVSWSKRWCAHQLELQKEIDAAKYCPECGKPTLTIEIGCYEESTKDYVYCDNGDAPFIDENGDENTDECPFTSDIEKRFEPLMHWYDFDVILAMNCGLIDRDKEFSGLGEWIKFVRKEIDKLPKAIVSTEQLNEVVAEGEG